MFTTVNSVSDLQKIIADKLSEKYPLLILGGGSNMLFLNDFEGLVIQNKIPGKEIVREEENFVYIKAGSGETWHELVMFCIEKSYGGVENLSLIPGSVGAAPMQNIGAYGVELKDVFYELEAIHLITGELKTFSLNECRFGYRESVFKQELKGQYFIVSVTLKLSKKPEFKSDYGQIKMELDRLNTGEICIKTISQAVCNIRRSKLPNPAEIGNAGSFFKNPVVSQEKYEELITKFPDLSAYPATNNVKLAAGWLIEKAGWKGKTFGVYGVHKNQALVLVNYGGAKGNDIYNLSTEIIQSVQNIFGVTLEREVNII